MQEKLKELAGRHIIIKLKGEAKARADLGFDEVRTSGELAITLLGHDMIRGVSVDRLGLASSGIRSRRGDSGMITLLGDHANAAVRYDDQSVQIDMEVLGRVHYELLDLLADKAGESYCYHLPEFEPVSTRVQLTLADGGKTLRVRELSLRMVGAGDGPGAIRELMLDLTGPEVIVTDPPGGNVQNYANSPYDPCDQVNRRLLRCRPVFFRSSATDPNPTGFTSAAQFATAQTVWDKGCIDIDILAEHEVTDATLKTSSDLTAIRAAFTDPATDIIEVYFVDNLLTATGGGNAGAIGTAACKVVLAEPSAGNPVLLAHELGHVLGLLHPPGTGSELGTVMQPTGSASNPGTEFVTHPMVLNIANPVLDTLTTVCCLSHDTGDHYIRDFPADAGQEPSDPLPAGMTRYSMSNVWNRRTNTPGTWSPTTGPAHESPYRFENDGVTPAQNYFYARVEQLNNFGVITPQVKYYLKTPGSGSGTALNSLGTAPVAVGLVVGNERDAVLQWTVPSGTPNHSCCFAVVYTDAEPEGNPTTLSWSQFEDMCRQDNDWAQRNLDVLDIDPSNSGNVWEAPTWIIELPERAEIRESELVLTAALTGEILESAVIEIPGGERIELKPGVARRFKTGIVLRPGQRLPVFLKGRFRDGAKIGSAADILVDPAIGKANVVGFGTRFQVTDNKRAKRMWLDRTIAAVVDIAERVNDEAWFQLGHELRELAGDRVPHLHALAEKLVGSDAVRSAVEGMAGWPAAEAFALKTQVEALFEAMDRGDHDAFLVECWALMSRGHQAVDIS